MRTRFLLVILLGLVLFAPTALATQGAVTLSSISIQGGGRAEGDLQLLHTEGAVRLDIFGDAQAMRVEHFTKGALVVDENETLPEDISEGLSVDDPTFCVENAGSCFDVQTSYFEHANLRASASSSYVAQVFPYSGTAQIDHEFQGLDMAHNLRAHMEGGFSGDPVDSPKTGDEVGHGEPSATHSSFTERMVTGDVLVATSDATTSTVLTGNFVIELIGVHATIGSGEVQNRYQSGVTQENFGPVSKQTIQFTRLYIEGGSIVIQQEGGKLSWAQRSFGVETASSSQTTFGDAVGVLLDGGERIELSGDVYRLAGAIQLALTASNGAAQTIVSEPASTASPDASAPLMRGPFTFIIAAAAILIVAVAGILVRRKSPGIHSIEALLESGDYDRAAKVATRAIRATPQKESAHLARAIAWSRNGKADQVVSKLGRFINENDPSDGTLHYVLGLAHKDLGQEARARDAMEEAVRRTPSLLSQMDSGMRGPETHAHAYT